MDDIPRSLCIKLGFAGLLAIIALVSILSINFSHAEGRILIGHFNNVGSLTAGHHVRLAGLPVGKVTSVIVDPKQFNVIVTMQIDSHMALPDDSLAAVRTTGLFGSPYIKLDPGGSSHMLSDGERITKTDNIIPIASRIADLIRLATD